MLILWYVTTRMISGCKFLFYTQTLFEQCWAIFFLRHLANMSSMVPFWASTDSGFVPNLGPASEATPSGGVFFIFLMTAAHISPNVFSLRNFLSNVHVLLLIVHSTSFIPIIHHIWTSNYIFYLHDKFTLSFLRIFIAGRLPSVSCVRYSYNLLFILFWIAEGSCTDCWIITDNKVDWYLISKAEWCL